MTIFFFFNDTATTEIYTLSLHDALPICSSEKRSSKFSAFAPRNSEPYIAPATPANAPDSTNASSLRSEEHTSELQSRQYLVCRLLLEKKNTISPSLIEAFYQLLNCVHGR